MSENNFVAKLNVGGVKYDVAYSTLTTYKDSMLTKLVSGTIPTAKLKNRIFIDRDGETFKHIVEFLRNGNNWVMPREPDILKKINCEAEFYMLDELVKITSSFMMDPTIKYQNQAYHKKYPNVHIFVKHYENSAKTYINLRPVEFAKSIAVKNGFVAGPLKTNKFADVINDIMDQLSLYDYEMYNHITISPSEIFIYYFRPKR